MFKSTCFDFKKLDKLAEIHFPAQELQMRMIKKLYARHYDIKQLFVSPSDSGHSGVSRDRTYLIMNLRAKVRMVADPIKEYED